VPRILSGVQPTGNTHLGNYVGGNSGGHAAEAGARASAEGACGEETGAMSSGYTTLRANRRSEGSGRWLLNLDLASDGVPFCGALG
jgi:hypothetical protein